VTYDVPAITAVGVAVGVGVGVAVGVGVRVGTCVAVGDAVLVAIGLGEGVIVGDTGTRVEHPAKAQREKPKARRMKNGLIISRWPIITLLS
jgi:hypothetical protein